MNHSQPNLTLAKSIHRRHDIVLVGLTATANGNAMVGVPVDLEKAYQKKFGLTVLELAQDLNATSEAEKVVVLPSAAQRIVVVGLGDPDVDPGRVRDAVAAAVRVIEPLGDKPLQVAISLELADPELIQAAGEAALTGSYVYAKQTANPKPRGIAAFELISGNTKQDAKDAADRARIVGTAVCQARDLINTAPNVLYPESFVAKARALLKDVKVDIEALDEKALEKGGYGGLMAVGGGSSRKPRLLRVEYKPRGAKTKLALVGKGITFDSGGLDIKSAAGMLTMKCDMAGAAAVLLATQAIATIGLKVHVVSYLALAENLPSDTAYRPSDVLSIYGGKTVENHNTDAEGRLVMADALSRSNADNADLVVDVATLTGACVMALGSQWAGIMASDDQTADTLLDAAEAAGENFWELPITDHARNALDSSVADIQSGTTAKAGGALVAAAFLQNFVDEGRSWAHLDIAGPAFNEAKPYRDIPAGGTGFGVRTLVALATRLAG